MDRSRLRAPFVSAFVCGVEFHHFLFQDPAGIFELIEVVGNGTYGQVHKVGVCLRKRERT